MPWVYNNLTTWAIHCVQCHQYAKMNPTTSHEVLGITGNFRAEQTLPAKYAYMVIVRVTLSAGSFIGSAHGHATPVLHL